MTPARTLPALAAVTAALLLTGCSGGDDTSAETAATLSGEQSTSVPSEPEPSEPSEPAAPSGDPEATDDAADPESTDARDAGPGAAVGEVVEGFPGDLIAVYPGAEVALTSAVPSGEELDVTLAGRSGDAPEAVVEFYRQRLVAAGFAEAAPGAGSAGALSATFTRGGGDEVISVAVVSTAGVPPQQFTVGGTITPTP